MANTSKLSGIHYEIMRRCYDPNSVMYKKYGGRGIEVCDEWHDRECFKLWAKESGWKAGLRLERIDGAKNYEPDNCKFGTKYRSRRSGDSIEQKKSAPQKSIPVFNIYKGMHIRCERITHKDYKYYGARGISVCDEWSGQDGLINFWNWSRDHGWQNGLTIDRIDNNGNYSPKNCRWISIQDQQNNRRDSQRFNYHGDRKSVAEIAKLEGISYSTAYKLLVGRTMDVGVYFDAIRVCETTT